MRQQKHLTAATPQPQVAFVIGTACLAQRKKASNRMVMVKKSAGSGGAPSLDILAARLRIVQAELSLEEKQVNLDNGRSFVAEPNLNVKVEVVKNLVEPGTDEGVRFYDRFKLKKDDDGDWTFAKYSKLGNLIAVRYGEGWFEDPSAGFEEGDFEGFEFVAQVEPKTDPKGKPLTGSVINWKSMRAAGGSDENTAQELKEEAQKDPHEELMRARKAATEAKRAEAEKEEEEDFDDIPF